MQITIERAQIDEVIIVKPELYKDERGFFAEVYLAIVIN